MSDDDPHQSSSEEQKSEEPQPLEVVIKNKDKPKREWNDSVEDIEYEELGITKEDMDI